MIIKPSKRKEKRFQAIFPDNTTIHFGSKGASTYIDNGNKKKRENYIKRHQVNEDFNNPKTAGALSRWILWGDSTNIDKNISDFKKKFNV
jgi:hypothetical protein